MIKDNKVLIAYDENGPVYLYPKMANRHGLIAGATGTGKTTTVRVLAESFSELGVPVFVSDVKGDLSGLCKKGSNEGWINKKVQQLNLEWQGKSCPTRYWDLFGELGHPVRVSVSQMGPTLFARLLNLTQAQEGVLNIVFKVADDQGLEIIDLKDLRGMLQFVGDHKNDYITRYGNISSQSIGVIQRALLSLEDEGGNIFFGEPSLDIKDWIRTNVYGQGFINILNATSIINSKQIYSIFMLWMLSELYEKLPEVGDLDKPRIVFFFDEAHLLFSDAPKALVDKITQVVKLIRSKGVGIYFISQSPMDIPEPVLAQLSNRVQHALRAYTPNELKAVKVAASTFRANPNFNTEEEISNLGIGQALVSFLDEGGIPTIVAKAEILPPETNDGPASAEEIQRIVAASEFDLKYRDPIDRVSAYEILMKLIEDEKARLEEEEKKIEVQKNEEVKTKLEKKAATNRSRSISKAASRATSTLTRGISSNLVKSITGKKTTSMSTIAQRAATNTINSLLSDATKSIARGLFGNWK